MVPSLFVWDEILAKIAFRERSSHISAVHKNEQNQMVSHSKKTKNKSLKIVVGSDWCNIDLPSKFQVRRITLSCLALERIFDWQVIKITVHISTFLTLTTCIIGSFCYLLNLRNALKTAHVPYANVYNLYLLSVCSTEMCIVKWDTRHKVHTHSLSAKIRLPHNED